MIAKLLDVLTRFHYLHLNMRCHFVHISQQFWQVQIHSFSNDEGLIKMVLKEVCLVISSKKMNSYNQGSVLHKL